MQSSTLLPTYFKEFVRLAFDAYRKRQIVKLLDSPLLQSNLFIACLLPGETDTPDLRSRLLQSLIRWVIERLQPGGSPDYNVDDWRIYTVLHDYYHARQPIERLAQTLGVSVSAVYYWRAPALKIASTILYRIWQPEQAIDEIRRYLLSDRYRFYASPNEQRVIEILAHFATPVQLNRFPLLSEILGRLMPLNSKGEQREGIVADLGFDWSVTVAQLTSRGWLMSEADCCGNSLVALLPELRMAVLPILTPLAQRQAQMVATAYYIHQQNFLFAAQMLLQANESEAAACLLLKEQEVLLCSNELATLACLVRQFQRSHLAETIWLQIKQFADEVAQRRTAHPAVTQSQPSSYALEMSKIVSAGDSQTAIIPQNKHQRKQILRWDAIHAYLKNNKSITCKTYARLVQLSERQAGRDLADWVVAQRLIQVGQARAVTYRLAA